MTSAQVVARTVAPLAGDVKAAGTTAAGIGAAPVLANAASAPIVAAAVLPVVSGASAAAAIVPADIEFAPGVRPSMASSGINAATVIPAIERSGIKVATVAPSMVVAPIVQPGIESAGIKTATVVPGIESAPIVAPTVRLVTEFAGINAASVVPRMDSARIVAPTFHPAIESVGINPATVVPSVALAGTSAAAVVPGMESARIDPASALPVRQRPGSTPIGYEMSNDARVVDGATRSLKRMETPIAQPPLVRGDGATSVGAARIDEAHFVPETLSAHIVSPTALRGIASSGINAAATVVPGIGSGSIDPASFFAAAVSQSGNFLTLTNGFISLWWELTHGTLVDVFDVPNARRFLNGGPASSNWQLWVDSSSNIWAPEDRRWGLGQRYDGRGITLSRWWWDCFASGTCIVHLKWINVRNTHVDITQHIRLDARDQVSHWTTTVDNGGSGTVTALLSPHVAGLNTLENESLMWPEHEGYIYPNPGTTRRFMQYPVPASMQWIHLFNEQQGLYFAVLDATARYKEFRFGYDPDIDPYNGYPARAISVTNWPFATQWQTWTSAQTELGVMTSGGWFPGADRYRSWLVNQSGWATPRQPLARSLVSYRSAAIKQFDHVPPPPPNNCNASCLCTKPGCWNLHHNYGDVANLLLAPLQPGDSSSVAAYNNLSQVMLGGWHIDGFDTRYPDYEFFNDPGGIGTRLDLSIQAFVLALAGKNLMFYENLHAADKHSRWFNAFPPDGCAGIFCPTQGEIGALKDLRGNTYPEEQYCLTGPSGFPPFTPDCLIYGAGGLQSLPHFLAMCPSYRPWQDQLVARAQALHDIGGQGFWFDQVEEKEAVLCYDRRHGHSSPATAFSEGYGSLLARMRALMADRPYIFFAEGISDYYSKYIDIAGGSFSRHFGYKPEHAPEVTRYTIPTRILGQQTDLDAVGYPPLTASWYGRAFLMGLPIDSGVDRIPRGATISTWEQTNLPCPAVPRMPDIYQFRPEIYLDGRYDADKAVSTDNPASLRVSTLTAANGNFAVQLVNESTSEQNGIIKVDLGKLGLGGRVVASVRRLDSSRMEPMYAMDPNNHQFSCNFFSSAQEHLYPSLRFTRIGNLLEFAEPFYAAGDVRSYVVTLGTLGAPPP